MKLFFHNKVLNTQKVLFAFFILISAIYFSNVIFENKDFFTKINQDKAMIISQEKTDNIIGEIQDEMTITQKFEVNGQANLEIKIPFGTFKRANTGELYFDLKENGQVIEHKIFDVSQLPDSQDISIEIPNSDNDSKKRLLEFEIKSKGLSGGNSVTLWRSNNQLGEFFINDQIQDGSIYFKLFASNTTAALTNGTFYLLLISFLLLFVVVTLLIFKFRGNVQKIFVILSLSIGLFFVVIFPPFEHLDELDHFYRAYEVSEGKFINQTVNGELGNNIPTSLISTVNKVRYVHYTGYQYNVVKDTFSMELNPQERVFHRNYASIYSPVLYIPQALGVLLGRIFNSPPIMMLYLGRLFNFLAYVITVFFSLKILPFKKNLFLVIALLPMTLIQATSLSADALMIGSSFLFISVVLNLGYNKKILEINTKDFWILTTVGMYMSISKPVYLPLLLLIFAIPYQKFGDKIKYTKKILIILVSSLLPMLIWNLLNLKNLAVPDVRGDTGISPSNQVHYVLTHPFRYIKTMFDTLISLGDSQFMGMLGKVVTNYGYSLSSSLVFGFIFLLLFTAILKSSDYERDSLTINVKGKLIFVVIIVGVIILTYTALYTGYTTVGNNLILGIQGRYFIPVSPLLFLIISSNNIVIKDRKIDIYVILSLCLLLFIVLLNYILKINGAIPF